MKLRETQTIKNLLEHSLNGVSPRNLTFSVVRPVGESGKTSSLGVSPRILTFSVVRLSVNRAKP